MGRPTNHGVTPVQLHTFAGNPTDLGVFQSLDVRAAPPKSALMAQGLADVLGVAMPVAEKAVEMKAKQGAQQGIADATAGKVDDSKVRKSLGYQEGVKKIETQKTMINASTEWQAFYADHVDKTLPTAEVAKQFDGFMKERLGEIAATDPKMAAKLAPQYMQQMQNLVVHHQSQLSQQHLADAHSVIQQEVMDATAHGQPIDFKAHVDTLFKLTGNKDQSIAAVASSVGEIAMSSGNPDILQQLPTDQLSPAMRDHVKQWGKAAEAKWMENHKVERNLQKTDIEAGWIKTQAAGRTIPEDTLKAQLKEKRPLFTQDEIVSYLRGNESVRRANALQKATTELPRGIPYYSMIGTADGHGGVITEEDVKRQTDRDVESVYARLKDSPAAQSMSDEEKLAFAATQTTATESFPYRPLKATLEHVPLDDAKGFANAAKAFSMLPVSQRAKYVSDPKRRADFETFLDRSNNVGATQAMSELVTADPEVVHKRITAAAPALREERAKLQSAKIDDSAFWWFNDVRVSDLQNANAVMRQVEENATMRIGRSDIPPAKAFEAALKDVASRGVVVSSPSGKRFMPRLNDGTTEKLGDAIGWAESSLKDFGKAKGIKVPDGSYLSYDPASRNNGELIVIGPDLMPIAPAVLRFNPQQLELLFKKQHPDGTWGEVQKKALQTQQNEKAHEAYQNTTAYGHWMK